MTNDVNNMIRKANQELAGLEKKFIRQYNVPKGPVFFIVGAPRSGTTVLLQTIINHFQLAYINNFIAKFWKAPVIGAMFFKSMSNTQPELSYHSIGGFTSDVYGPHEFGYFWRRFFPYGESHALDKEVHDDIDAQTLNREIAGLEIQLEKPMIFKNPAALSLQIDFISKYIPNSFFIYIKREPFYIAQSLFLKRMDKFKDPNIWYSVKPANYKNLIQKQPAAQIAGQVFYSIRKIEDDLSEISTERVYTLNYEEFCKNPVLLLSQFEELRKFIISDSMETGKDLSFKNNNQILIDKENVDNLKSQLDELYQS